MTELIFDPAQRVEAIAHHMEVVGDRATELEPVMWEIVDKIMYREKRMFATRGATSGVYWAPLRGTTVRIKQKRSSLYPFSPLLRDLDLERSLTVQYADHQILDVTDRGFDFGTTHPSAKFHETGTRNMPKRPPLIIPKKHAQEYIKMIGDYVLESEDEY